MELKFVNNNKLLQVVKASKLELQQLSMLATEKSFDRFKRKYSETSYFHNYTYIPAGMWLDVKKLQKSNYSVDIDFSAFFNSITLDDVHEWVSTLDLPFEPYEYQIQAVFNAVKYRICRAEVATSGGKTLIMYLIAKLLIDKFLETGKKILIVVPKIFLVKQTFAEFADFCKDNSVRSDMVYSNSTFVENSNVVIGNIDSLVNYNPEYFKQFSAVIFDEAHKINTTGYKKILHFLAKNELVVTHGLSGTFHKRDSTAGLTEEALLGPILLEKSASEIQAEGRASAIDINQIHIKYSKEQSAGYYLHPDVDDISKRFTIETEFVRSSKARIKLIATFARKLDNNSVLLFRGKKYVKLFYSYLTATAPEKKVFIIYGGVSQDERTEIAEYLETHDNCIVCATYQTIDTGISINNIHNILAVESARSFIRVRQSIGRGLRLHESKDVFQFYDFVDCLDRGNHETGPPINIMRNHAAARRKIYDEQKFPYKKSYVDLTKFS